MGLQKARLELLCEIIMNEQTRFWLEENWDGVEIEALSSFLHRQDTLRLSLKPLGGITCTLSARLW
jgi:hypothetical protein